MCSILVSIKHSIKSLLMFRKYTVPVPSVPGKIRIKKNGNGSRYSEYEVGRKYNREKRYNVPVRKTIGLLDDVDETGMHPNDNYFAFFSPLDSGYVYGDEYSLASFPI